MATNTGDDYSNEIYNDNGGDPDYSRHRDNYVEQHHGKPVTAEEFFLGLMILSSLIFVPLLVFNFGIGTFFLYFVIICSTGGMWNEERKWRNTQRKESELQALQDEKFNHVAYVPESEQKKIGE